MDLKQLMSSRINQILSNVGDGMKVMIMDSDTTTSLSLSCPQSEIMKKEVFLFEYLHNRGSATNALGFMKCVVLLRPEKDNVRMLAHEIGRPRYGSYYVYFTNRVPRADVKMLAESDINELVQDIKEIPSDYMVLESHVFTFSIKNPIRNLQWDTYAFQRTVESLKSLMLSLRSTKPRIAFVKNSKLCEELATAVYQQMYTESNLPKDQDWSISSGSKSTKSLSEAANLIIVDRRTDPVTPLLNQWTYQAMIHELLGTKNNTIDLNGRDDVADELKQLTLSASSDEFYRHNMYANFGEIGQTIQKLVQSFQEKVKGHKKIDSIGDIKEFVSSYPEFKKMSGTVNKHVALLSELSKEVKENRLMEVSECEQTLACGMDKDNTISKVQEILSLPNIRPKDALRIVGLFCMRYSHIAERNIDLLCRSVKGLPKKETFDFIQTIVKYGRSDIKSRQLFDDSTKPFTAHIMSSLRGTENVYTQHQPLITREILPDILKAKQRSDMKYLEDNTYEVLNETSNGMDTKQIPKKTVIFVIGGFTYEETRAVYMANKELPNSNTIIGGTSLLNFDTFMDEAKVACNH